ncbi:hypothetical protein OPAG_01956 [Rhodococcus opacus PD630]|nr:hypothetical protein Pd630_LPD07638 [Rhodococcus opacus PD630]EHI39297.1 hypothetical protein OPAG_01956 [Rhodococcus opacus PD630]
MIAGGMFIDGYILGIIGTVIGAPGSGHVVAAVVDAQPRKRGDDAHRRRHLRRRCVGLAKPRPRT